MADDSATIEFRKLTLENQRRSEELEKKRAADRKLRDQKLTVELSKLRTQEEKSSGDAKELLKQQIQSLERAQREEADMRLRDQELLKITASSLGVNEKQLEASRKAREEAEQGRTLLDDVAGQLKRNGIKLDGESRAAKNYRKMDLEVKKKERAAQRRAMPIGSALMELGKDQAKALGNALKPYLGKGSFLGDTLLGVGKSLKQKVVGGIDTLFGVLKKGLFVASIAALIAFFNSDAWIRLKDKLVPALARAFKGLSNFMKDLPKTIDEITKAFEKGGFFAGLKRIGVALGLVRDDINEGAKEAEGFGLREFGITAGILLLGRGLASIGGVIAGAASSLMVATGAKPLTAGGVGKAVGLKEGQEIKSKSGTFRVGKGGVIEEQIKGGGFQRVKDQGKVLTQLADEGALPKATAGKISKLGKGALKTLSFLRGLPLIGQALAINDIIQLIMAPGSPSSKVDDLAGLIGAIGGTSLGATLGAIAGSIVPGIGNFIGGGIGALAGYFGGKTIAQGLAQYMLGMSVDAFPDLPFLPNFNDVLNNRAAEQRENIAQNKFQATLPTTGTFGLTGGEFDTFQQSQAAKINPFNNLLDNRAFDRSNPMFNNKSFVATRQRVAKTLEKQGLLDQFRDRFEFGDLPKAVQARELEMGLANFSGEGMGGNLNVYNAGGDTINNMSKTVTPRYLQDQDTATRAGTLSLAF